MPARKYHFTDRIDDAIREAYRKRYQEGELSAIRDLEVYYQQKLGWPLYVVKLRAVELGCTRTKAPVWMPEEEELLRAHGHLSNFALQQRLWRKLGIRRSLGAIRDRLAQHKIRSNLDGYTVRALSVAFGVDWHVVEKWIQRGMLRAVRRESDAPNCRFWITHNDVRDFISAYPNEFHLASVEKFWFLDLLTHGKISDRTLEVDGLKQRADAAIAEKRELAGQLAAARTEISRLQRDLAHVQTYARKLQASQHTHEEERRMDRREMANLRREITRMQKRGLAPDTESEPVDFAESDRPVSAVALIAAIGRQVGR